MTKVRDGRNNSAIISVDNNVGEIIILHTQIEYGADIIVKMGGGESRAKPP